LPPPCAKAPHDDAVAQNALEDIYAQALLGVPPRGDAPLMGVVGRSCSQFDAIVS